MHKTIGEIPASEPAGVSRRDDQVAQPHQFLGFAFASADLLIEVQSEEEISFAIGAAGTLAGNSERALVGCPWRRFVDERDHTLIEALFAGLGDDARQGPLLARVASPDCARQQAFLISACRLGSNGGAISCAINRAEPLHDASEGGLLDRLGFDAVAKDLLSSERGGGPALELALVEMTGFAKASNSLPRETARSLQGRLAGALRAQSYQGTAAADLGSDRFGLLRATSERPEVLAARLARLLALVADMSEVKVAARTMALYGDLAPAVVLRGVRRAMDAFLSDGIDAVTEVDLAEVVSRSIRDTLAKANAFGAVVAERQFKLVYQPVVEVSTGRLHHHEALVRFGEEESPFPAIRMAEELDMIESLDLAISERVVGELKTHANLSLAVNVSGRTITSSSFASGVARLVGADAALARRLIFEVTESAAIDDLDLADRQVQALRKMGCLVCLDDFGAGAASLAYLQQLRLDLVKIDGRYIRHLQHGGRDAKFIAQLVKMCRELGVKTLAEMVEGPRAEEAVRLSGVDFAQGWLYGAPSDRPEQPRSNANVRPALRRAGAG